MQGKDNGPVYWAPNVVPSDLIRRKPRKRKMQQKTAQAAPPPPPPPTWDREDAFVVVGGIACAACLGFGLLIGGFIFSGTKVVTKTQTVEIEKPVEVYKDVPEQFKKAMNWKHQTATGDEPLLAGSEKDRGTYFTTFRGQRGWITPSAIYIRNIDCSSGSGSLWLDKGELQTLFTTWAVALREEAAASAAITKQMAEASRTLGLADMEVQRLALTVSQPEWLWEASNP
jgi:hypothetical protein